MRRVIEAIFAIILALAFFTGIATILTLGVIIVAAVFGYDMASWLAAIIVAIVAVAFVVVSED